MTGFQHRTEPKHYKKKSVARRQQYYTVYLSKTDTIVASGTADECVKQLGITKSSFYRIVSMARDGISKKYTVLQEDY